MVASCLDAAQDMGVMCEGNWFFIGQQPVAGKRRRENRGEGLHAGEEYPLPPHYRCHQ